MTPQIDEANMITLHLRPSVTTVTEKTKQIDLGAIGNYRLPLASSSVNETDTVVRVQDGNIVAIGGLMQIESTRRSSGLPGSNSSAVGRTLLSNQADSGRKKELVVLIRPTIIRNAEDWERTTTMALGNLDPRETRRVITVSPGQAPVISPAAAPAATPAPTPAAATLATTVPVVPVTTAVAPVAAPAPSAAPTPATAPASAAVAATAATAATAAAAAPAAAAAAAKKSVKPRATRSKSRRGKAGSSAKAVKPGAVPTVAQPRPAAAATVAAQPATTLLAWAWPTRW